jgi:hypothetical protein
VVPAAQSAEHRFRGRDGVCMDGSRPWRRGAAGLAAGVGCCGPRGGVGRRGSGRGIWVLPGLARCGAPPGVSGVLARPGVSGVLARPGLVGVRGAAGPVGVRGAGRRRACRGATVVRIRARRVGVRGWCGSGPRVGVRGCCGSGPRVGYGGVADPARVSGTGVWRIRAPRVGGATGLARCVRALAALSAPAIGLALPLPPGAREPGSPEPGTANGAGGVPSRWRRDTAGVTPVAPRRAVAPGVASPHAARSLCRPGRRNTPRGLDPVAPGPDSSPKCCAKVRGGGAWARPQGRRQGRGRAGGRTGARRAGQGRGGRGEAAGRGGGAGARLRGRGQAAGHGRGGGAARGGRGEAQGAAAGAAGHSGEAAGRDEAEGGQPRGGRCSLQGAATRRERRKGRGGGELAWTGWLY